MRRCCVGEEPMAAPTSISAASRSARSRLRPVALSACIVGAASAISLVLYTGRHNPSWLLLALFAGWVSLPFLFLLCAIATDKRWSATNRVALYTMSLLITLASLTIYAEVAFGSPRVRVARFF